MPRSTLVALAVSTALVVSTALAFTSLTHAQPLAWLDGDQFRFASPITFVDGTTISPDGERALADVVRVLLQRPDLRVKIGVHTDSRGSSAFNLRTSQLRADAVRAWLESHGIGASRVRAEGYGETMPIDTNATEAGRARNSRVEIRALPR